MDILLANTSSIVSRKNHEEVGYPSFPKKKELENVQLLHPPGKNSMRVRKSSIAGMGAARSNNCDINKLPTGR